MKYLKLYKSHFRSCYWSAWGQAAQLGFASEAESVRVAGDCKGTKVPNSAEACSQIKDVPGLHFESGAMRFVEKQGTTVGNQPLETLLDSAVLVQRVALWDHRSDGQTSY